MKPKCHDRHKKIKCIHCPKYMVPNRLEIHLKQHNKKKKCCLHCKKFFSKNYLYHHFKKCKIIKEQSKEVLDEVELKIVKDMSIKENDRGDKPSKQEQTNEEDLKTLSQKFFEEEVPKKEIIEKISFNTEGFSDSWKKSFKEMKKLTNFELMVDSNFLLNPTIDKVKKMQNKIFIYEICHQQITHFGTILKYDNEIITFDGIEDFWPFKTKKSYHWEEQLDDWSCGYRAHFWKKEIEKIGIDRWVKNFE